MIRAGHEFPAAAKRRLQHKARSPPMPHVQVAVTFVDPVVLGVTRTAIIAITQSRCRPVIQLVAVSIRTYQVDISDTFIHFESQAVIVSLQAGNLRLDIAAWN